MWKSESAKRIRDAYVELIEFKGRAKMYTRNNGIKEFHRELYHYYHIVKLKMTRNQRKELKKLVDDSLKCFKGSYPIDKRVQLIDEILELTRGINDIGNLRLFS